jgi:iron complex outermembrane receptor protein
MSKRLITQILRSAAMISIVIVTAHRTANAQIADATAPTTSAASTVDSEGLAEITVTATKREQSLSRVPMSVNAASGAEMTERGITEVSDLGKLVPGFQYTESAFGTPVYTLRGVGFYDTSLAAKPSVSVYVDEVALPFSILTSGASLDLQRVEVLKGPQGTLFGQNSTGGAINYIAAKPTDHFEAGGTIGYARFGEFTGEAYISGPITDTLTARFAIKTENGGAWQRSLTRPDDVIGNKNFQTARLLIDFRPIDRLKFELNLNGFLDKSDEMVSQFFALTPLANPARAGALDAEPRATSNAYQGDWTPSPHPKRDHHFYQASLRGDFQINSNLTLTSISAYSQYHHDQNIDPDGVALNDYFYHTTGHIRTFSEEARISGQYGPLNFIVGANYSNEQTRQKDENTFLDATSAYQFTDTFAALGVPNFPPFFGFVDQDKQNFIDKAAFANIDYSFSEKFVVHGGVRYTKDATEFAGCTEDNGGGTLALGYQTVLNSIRGSLGLAPTTVPPGGCVSINIAALEPALATGYLDESNVSWRVGVDYLPTPDILNYLSVSRGFKSGSFPLLAASDVAQFSPVTQEEVTAYELGTKASFFDHKVRVTAAVFYYDYLNKQLKGRSISNPDIFGPLERLFNVPKSSIKGAEVQLDVRPVTGLTVSIGATYLDTRVVGTFNNIDSYGTARNFEGSPFPYSPKWQGVADSQYEFDVASRFRAFVGGSVTAQSYTISALGPQNEYPYPGLNAAGGLGIPAYTLLGLRAGIASKSDKYRVTIYGDNLADRYYWTNATRITDTTVRYPGMPRTFGIRLMGKF